MTHHLAFTLDSRDNLDDYPHIPYTCGDKTCQTFTFLACCLPIYVIAFVPGCKNLPADLIAGSQGYRYATKWTVSEASIHVEQEDRSCLFEVWRSYDMPMSDLESIVIRRDLSSNLYDVIIDGPGFACKLPVGGKVTKKAANEFVNAVLLRVPFRADPTQGPTILYTGVLKRFDLYYTGTEGYPGRKGPCSVVLDDTNVTVRSLDGNVTKIGLINKIGNLKISMSTDMPAIDVDFASRNVRGIRTTEPGNFFSFTAASMDAAIRLGDTIKERSASAIASFNRLREKELRYAGTL